MERFEKVCLSWQGFFITKYAYIIVITYLHKIYNFKMKDMLNRNFLTIHLFWWKIKLKSALKNLGNLF